MKTVRDAYNLQAVLLAAPSMPLLTSLTLVLAPEMKAPARSLKLFSGGQLARLRSLHIDAQVWHASPPVAA